ncbi:MAG: hypothetical protein ACI8XB_000208 [Patiriisocius sp.]|jgi:hypothetical protein
MIQQAIKYIGLIFLVFPLVLHAQDGNLETKNEIIERRIEQLDTEDADIDYTSLFDALNIYYENPINLNNTSADELRTTYLLNDIQINALLKHIEANGKLLNIYELQTIFGFNADVIESILPFVKVGGKIDQSRLNLKRALKDGKHEIYLRYIRILEEQKGFSSIESDELIEKPNSRYLGSPDRLYMRYRFKYLKHISWGLTAEKDQGEELFQGSQANGFDFYSAHASLSNYGIVKNAVVGDFHAQFGQGLTLWTGQAFGKSIDLLSIKRNARGLKPYTSVDENLFLRGAGTTLAFGKFELSALASIKNVDANLQIDTINNIDNIFSSLQGTGLHSTPNELEDKDAIQETVFAGNIKYTDGLFSVGMTGARTAYEGQFSRNLQYYNQFEFSDNENVNVGMDYNWTYKNMNLFGEIAKSSGGGLGYVQGLIIALDRNLSAIALYRNYDRDFKSVNNTAIAENSKNVNENGLMLGLKANISKQWILSAYLDRFEFPWLKFGVDAPSRGHDGVAQLNWKPQRGTELYFRYRHRIKPKNSKLDGPVDFVVPLTQDNYRINLSSKVSPAIRLKTRVEWTKYKIDGGEENGFIAYQDITYKALSSPFSFSVRYALFDTDSYNSRVYAYESDVLYYFSIPAYANQGSRYYISTKYRINRNIDVWVRYSQWLYTNVDDIGSGLSEIDGQTKSEVKVQVRLKF